MASATLTWSFVGSSAGATELRRRLNEVGARLGYVTRRGPVAGRGGGAYILRDLAEGRAAVLPVEDPLLRAWLAEQLLRLADENPERAAGLLRAVEGLAVADDLEQRGSVEVAHGADD